VTAEVVGKGFDLGQFRHAFQARADPPRGSEGR
jgi:hypothetical protein